MIDITTLLFFALTVLPLICTPGPDIRFIASQGLSSGRAAARASTAGVGDTARRRIEGVAGFLLAGAAVKIATQ